MGDLDLTQSFHSNWHCCSKCQMFRIDIVVYEGALQSGWQDSTCWQYENLHTYETTCMTISISVEFYEKRGI